MDLTIFTAAAQLGGTVFTVVVFLWYLSKRDDKNDKNNIRQSEGNILLATALQGLRDVIIRNTTAVGQSIPTQEENTGAIKKNTDTIKKNGK
jgi:hypothetical protein